jgi:hypothetical protein
LRPDRALFLLPLVLLVVVLRADVREDGEARFAEPLLAGLPAGLEALGDLDLELELALERRAALRGVVARRPYSALASGCSMDMSFMSFIDSFGWLVFLALGISRLLRWRTYAVARVQVQEARQARADEARKGNARRRDEPGPLSSVGWLHLMKSDAPPTRRR